VISMSDSSVLRCQVRISDAKARTKVLGEFHNIWHPNPSFVLSHESLNLL
jgi:hypothetical protein